MPRLLEKGRENREKTELLVQVGYNGTSCGGGS